MDMICLIKVIHVSRIRALGIGLSYKSKKYIKKKILKLSPARVLVFFIFELV